VKKLYPFLFLILPFTAFAQKSVDLDKYRFRVQFRSLPAIKIDSSYRTFDVQVQTTKMMTPFMQDIEPDKSVRIEGWRKLSKNGHLSVDIKVGDLIPGDVAVKERVVTTKNSSGVITGTKTFYSQEVTYTFEAEAVITDYKGMHIIDEQLADRSYKHTYRSPEFTIKALAEGYFVLNSLAVTKDLFRENVINTMHSLSERLTTNFGYDEVTVNDFMWIIDTRKHPEYNNWKNAFQQMNEVLFAMTANKSIDGAKEQLKPVIGYFEKVRKIYSSNSRHDRKIRYATYFNLAVLYYYLDDPQSMMKEANGLALNDFDSKDAKGFETTATWLRNLFEQTNMNTRHFYIDVNAFKGPFDNANSTVSNKTFEY
jgi:hypothetical protein